MLLSLLGHFFIAGSETVWPDKSVWSRAINDAWKNIVLLGSDQLAAAWNNSLVPETDRCIMERPLNTMSCLWKVNCCMATQTEVSTFRKRASILGLTRVVESWFPVPGKVHQIVIGHSCEGYPCVSLAFLIDYAHASGGTIITPNWKSWTICARTCA